MSLVGLLVEALVLRHPVLGVDHAMNCVSRSPPSYLYNAAAPRAPRAGCNWGFSHALLQEKTLPHFGGGLKTLAGLFFVTVLRCRGILRFGTAERALVREMRPYSSSKWVAR